MLDHKYFLKVNTVTIGSVLVLILVGSIVRSLGAGMGCPDWPKCFGSYIPPTTSDQLPKNYLEIFREKRLSKNERLANTFNSLGYSKLALKITNDPFVLQEHEFNVTKAWIEYINRLVGVLIGFLVFANMIFSLAFWRDKKTLTVAGISIFILTGFQGWVGSLVVSTNLLHGFITFHMLLALFILALLIWMNVKGKEPEVYTDRKLFLACLFSLIIFIPQIVFGTNVRGIIDDLLVQEADRAKWINLVETGVFYLHRSYSWLILLSTILVLYLVIKYQYTRLKPYAIQLVVLVFIGMIAGIGMVKLDFPFWMQPLHLIVATGIFSLLFYLTLRIKFSN